MNNLLNLKSFLSYSKQKTISSKSILFLEYCCKTFAVKQQKIQIFKKLIFYCVVINLSARGIVVSQMDDLSWAR